MGHRNELIYSNTMKKFDAFGDIEAKINKLYSFYSQSTKRYNSFWEFLDLQDEDKIYFSKIYKVRWVTSHLKAIKGIYNNHHLITDHLQTIVSSPSSHTKKAIKKAEKLLDFLLDKSVLVIYPFNIDIQTSFSIESKIMQKKDDSIISQARAKYYLLDEINKMLMIEETTGETQKFLTSEAMCFDDEDIADIFIFTEKANAEITKKAAKATTPKEKEEILERLAPNPKPYCDSLEHYDASPVIVWRLQKFKTHLKNFKKLSSFKDDYIDKLNNFVDHYYPETEMQHFEALDQRFWNDAFDVETLIPDIKKIAKLLSIEDENIGQAFVDLFNVIKGRSDLWCNIHASNPVDFWGAILREVEVPSSLKHLIKSSLVIPLSSAEAERAFRLPFQITIISQIYT